MKEYFIAHFFKGLQSTDLNEKIKPLIKFASDINPSTIKSMVGSLLDGLPIPSKKKMTDEAYSETPSSVQEILLSAWMYRNDDLKKRVLEDIAELSAISNDDKFIQAIDEKVITPLSRFDFSVIRSIQVSEWFDILTIDGAKETVKRKNKKGSNQGAVLVDWEIESLIRKEELLIIPIIDMNTQLGSTSFDIRLGTSFQLFYPNKDGIFDVTETSAQERLGQSSMLRDLDFLEGLTLFPGQFVLGHSMEYLRLPRHIAAEVEGRSSFARLGIEVHMTAGFVEPGYEGVLTYEIYNAGANPVRLYPSTRIAQLRFFSTSTS